MATIFLEPGGDATGDVTFWPNLVGAPAVATDFVHGKHINSIKYRPNNTDYLLGTGFLSNAGGRFSIYVYLNALPNAQSTLFLLEQTGDGLPVVGIQITSAGVLKMVNDSGTIIGTGSTLTTGVWYRLCFAWTITSTTVNQFRLFIQKGSLVTTDITVSNTTLGIINVKDLLLGNGSGNVNLDLRSSDHYIDDSTALTDPGDIWITAKRPNANGTTNGFTTQIGSGGSGYGSGHSPQVNERPVSITNGWSVIAAGSAITEEYNIESVSQGDINITGATIVDYIGWVINKALIAETGKIIVNNVQTNISITTGNSLFRQVAGSTTYPAGTGTDIGMITATTATTVSLYECGIVVAYIPPFIWSQLTDSISSIPREHFDKVEVVNY